MRSELNRIEKEMTTTERIVPGRKLEATVPRKRFRYLMIPGSLILLILIVVIGYILINRTKQPEEEQVTAVAESPWQKKIVVLPFENLGSVENKYFTDGITSEITSRLASIRSLGIISRQTAVEYDRKGKTLRQIGEDLGVEYALEGTVLWDRSRESESRVRVIPQLIRTSDDTQLWSESYERDINDIFAVQSEIAEKVIRSLDINWLEKEQKALEVKPTENLEAYQAYLRGGYYAFRGGYREEDYRLAVQMYEKAVKLDPKFAWAFAGLSLSHAYLYHQGYDRTEERALAAKEAAEQALALQPESPESHLALGRYYYLCRKDYERALEELRIVQKGQPNNAEVMEWIAYIVRRQGKFEESVNLLKKSLELSPKSETLLHLNLGLNLLWLRRHGEANYYFDQSISLLPDQALSYFAKVWLQWVWKGTAEETRAILEDAPQQDDRSIIYCWYIQEIFEGNYQAALDKLSSAPEEFYVTQDMYIPWEMLAGRAYQLMSEEQLARKSYMAARDLLLREVRKQPEDSRIHSSLGIAYAALGQKKDAIREGKRAIDLYPISKDRLYGPFRVHDLAWIYVLLEEYDAALDQIEYLLSIPFPITIKHYLLDPLYKPLHDHPRFKRIVEKYSD